MKESLGCGKPNSLVLSHKNGLKFSYSNTNTGIIMDADKMETLLVKNNVFEDLEGYMGRICVRI